MGGSSRIILGLNPDLIVDRELDALPAEALDGLFHSIQLGHVLVRDDADSLRTQVFAVHADLLRGSGAKPDAGGGHLECVLLLLRGIDGRGEVPDMSRYRRDLAGLLLLMVVVGRVRVAWTARRMGVLDSPEQVERPGGRRGGDSDCREDHPGCNRSVRTS